MSDLAKRIAEARQAVGMTQQQVATALGIARVSVTQWENGTTNPGRERLFALAELLQVTPEWLQGRGDRGVASVPAVRSLRPVRPLRFAGGGASAARDFPIFAATQGGAGHMIIHTDPMEYLSRPTILVGVPDAYGILVTGDSMVPAYRAGDLALVHPRRPAERESDVILYKHDPRTGDAESIIKRLVSFTDKEWKLEQYHPAQVWAESRKDWPICHQVVGRYTGNFR